MFALNHFYCVSGISHFILNSEKWTWDILQAQLFLECTRSEIYWVNTYLLRGGACKHIINASHSGTKIFRGNKKQTRWGCFIEMEAYLIGILNGVWMSRGNLLRTAEGRCLSSSSVSRKPHASLRCFWTSVFILTCVSHFVAFMWHTYIFLVPKHAYMIVWVSKPRIGAFVT